MNIAFLRANGIGDFVVTLPALEAIKHRYPTSRLILLGRPWHLDFLRNRPSPVDEVKVIPTVPVLYEPGPAEKAQVPAMDEFLAEMRSLKLDIAIQGHGGGRYSNPFMKSLGARLTVGCRAADADSLDREVFYEREQHEIFRHLELAGLIEARPVTMEPRLAVTEEDLQAASLWLKDERQPLVVMQADAGDFRRRWPREKFLQVATWLENRGYRVVFNSPEMSLRALFGLLSRARLVVSNDSGPMHLAVAAETPCVGLFWHGNYMAYAPPRRARFRGLIAWEQYCKLCGRSLCEGDSMALPAPGSGMPCTHDYSWIERIPVDQVIHAVAEMLDERLI